ncbi:MAG TPA: FemAB family XrtA/PEP-CTERM system-associated protein [Nitrospiraceae bacterium]|nr:FemAB family XrtA/PEP-CTERM system-associated protein [Nitrospiraceae bacterium]
MEARSPADKRMLSAAIVDEGTPESMEWNRYVLASKDASGYHLLGWRRVIEESFGHHTCYVAAKDHTGRIRGVLPLVMLASRLFGKFLVSVPFLNYGGVVADDHETVSCLINEAIAQAKRHGARHIEIRNQQSCPVGLPLSQRKVSMRLDLPREFELLWKQFPSKLRSQIRRAQKENMVVRFGGDECLDDFYTVFARCMRDLGTPVYSKRFFGTICRQFPKESRICVVSFEGRPVAAGFLYGFRSVLEIPWAASDKRFNRLAPNMLLYSSILEHACREGFHVFDFGRSTPDTGTYRFKEQWGARPEQLHWYYWMAHGEAIPQLNPHNPKYEMAIKVWRRLPLVVANWLGPQIVKFLP